MSPWGLLRSLLRTKALQHGTFTLASGATSDVFLDCKLVTLPILGTLAKDDGFMTAFVSIIEGALEDSK